MSHPDPHEAAEAAGVAVYGGRWLTMTQLNALPHVPGPAWVPVDATDEDEPALPWVPGRAIERSE